MKFLGWCFVSVLILLSLVNAEVGYFDEFKLYEDYSDKGKVFVATQNLSSFLSLEGDLVYWPVLSKKEGYWISPWADEEGVERVFSELEGKKIPIMLDLEFPIERKLMFGVRHELIEEFIGSYEGEIYAIEITALPRVVLRWMGLSYDNTKRIRMYYSSFRREWLPDFFVDYLLRLEAEEVSAAEEVLALGLSDVGIYEDEPVLSKERLEKDIAIAKKAGVKEIIVFRLE